MLTIIVFLYHLLFAFLCIASYGFDSVTFNDNLLQKTPTKNVKGSY